MLPSVIGGVPQHASVLQQQLVPYPERSLAETSATPRQRHYGADEQGEGTQERSPYPPLPSAPRSEQDLQPVGYLRPEGGWTGYLAQKR